MQKIEEERLRKIAEEKRKEEERLRKIAEEQKLEAEKKAQQERDLKIQSMIEAEQYRLQKLNPIKKLIPKYVPVPTYEKIQRWKNVEHLWESKTSVSHRRRGWEAVYHEDWQRFDVRSLGGHRITKWQSQSYNHQCISRTNNNVVINSDNVTGHFVRGMKVHMDNFFSDTKFGRADFKLEIWYLKKEYYDDLILTTKSEKIDVETEELLDLSCFAEEARINVMKNLDK